MSTKLKIAILDDYNSLAEPYISSLKDEAEFTVFRDTILPSPSPEALIKRLEPFNVLCTMRERTPLKEEVLSKLPNLKIILTTGMRNAGIDMNWCKEHKVEVFGTAWKSLATAPENLSPTVQHTWALILALVDNIPRDQSLITSSPSGGHLSNGGHNPSTWISKNPLNTYLGYLTLGVLGLGKLGGGTAKIAILAFQMKVIAWSPNLTQEKADDFCQEVGLPKSSIQVVSKEKLFRDSDILSVHVVLSERSKGIVGKAELEKMKSSSFLINTSRGPLIDEKAFLDHLENGRIKGAAIDVFDVEPLEEDSKWRTTKWGEDGRSQVVMTPHTGYSFERNMHEMWEGTKENLERVVRGQEPENRIV